jgi:glycosyltransferase involved in cell wall biosynthesis
MVTERNSLLINGTTLLSTQTGIGRYTSEICRSICSLSLHRWDTTFFYGYFSKNFRPFNLDTPASISPFFRTLCKKPFIKPLAHKILSTYAHLSPHSFDLYWEPAIVPLPALQKKAGATVATVHDFSWHHHPEWHPEERVQRMTSAFWRSVSTIDAVITDSEYVRQEALSFLPLPAERIRCIHCGVNTSLFFKRDEKEVRAMLQPLKIPERYILITGTLEPRKNIIRAIKAWSMLPQKIKKEFPLVLAGADGWKNQEIRDTIKENSSIYMVGYVDDVTLANLYSGASLFLYPSLYEGFGLPPLEAMACGTPVLASNSSCIPDICGSSALFFDPLDEEELLFHLEELLSKPEKRKKLSESGLERASLFSWRKAAEEHLNFFSQIVEGTVSR